MRSEKKEKMAVFLAFFSTCKGFIFFIIAYRQSHVISRRQGLLGAAARLAPIRDAVAGAEPRDVDEHAASSSRHDLR